MLDTKVLNDTLLPFAKVCAPLNPVFCCFSNCSKSEAACFCKSLAAVGSPSINFIAANSPLVFFEKAVTLALNLSRPPVTLVTISSAPGTIALKALTNIGAAINKAAKGLKDANLAKGVKIVEAASLIVLTKSSKAFPN